MKEEVREASLNRRPSANNDFSTKAIERADENENEIL